MKILKDKEKLYTLLARLVIIGAFVVIAMISILSELGMHPDEWDVKACLDWGINHWIWPDMRASGLGDTYSWYGYTKVCNYTPYFLIMGKIAGVIRQFVDVIPYYRMPNLLLALLITVITVKNVAKKKYLLVMFGICVQAWYIFAYVTADALDFVWAFVAIYLLADEDSLLWRTVSGADVVEGETSLIEARVAIIVKCILLGILYGCMLLGKPYYYANMVLTFIVLVNHLAKSSFNQRKTILGRYILIVCVAGLIFAGRYGLDRYYYGADKAQIKNEMADIYSSDDKKPSTPVEEQCVTYHMASKGYSIGDLFKYDEHWGLKTYRSFASARVTIDGDNWYFLLMAIGYIAIYGCMAWSIMASRNKTDVIILISATILSVGGVIASILNSYMIDAQAQGRYLLPIILTMGYVASRVPRLWEKNYFRLIVLGTACLSLMYFGLFDSRKLIDLAYVRGTFF